MLEGAPKTVMNEGKFIEFFTQTLLKLTAIPFDPY